ncbi:MAG: DUF3617 family protein [Desulfobacteraceae bacterium]|nr:DUF3617 family protein [Desulfobacteraceae bacterium]
MKKTLLVIAAVLSMPAVAMAGSLMRPGLWEITMKMEMPGMPMAMRPVKMTHCYTPQDVSDTSKTIPKDNGCKLQNHNVSGNKVTWTVVCDEKHGNMKGDGEITYGNDSYEGTIKTSMQGPNGPMNTIQRYSGKRIGDCKK